MRRRRRSSASWPSCSRRRSWRPSRARAPSRRIIRSRSIPAAPSVTGHTLHYLREADVVFGIGCSFTRHGMAASIPAGKTLIHATNDERDLNKSYAADHPAAGRRTPRAAPVRRGRQGPGGPPGRPGGRARRARARARGVARGVGAHPRLGRGAHDPVPGDGRVHARGRPARGHRHPRLRQPARPAPALLPRGLAARLPRLGQVARRSAPGSVSSSGPSSPRPTSSA